MRVTPLKALFRFCTHPKLESRPPPATFPVFIMSDSLHVLVLDGVSPKGVEKLSALPNIRVTVGKSLSEAELIAQIQGVDALVVRSQTKVTRRAMESADRLKVVGRAGVGVDNVDLAAASELGIVVMNTPGGNTISTAEHAFSLLLSIARNIPRADASVKAGQWDRKTFQGVEIYGKTLGIIGMGRIGTEVARRAMAFGMRVLAYDPYLAASRARSLQVELFEDLEAMLPLCDFITLHIPMTDETRGMLNARTLGLCKKSVRLINCARGGLINEADLARALTEGTVAGAAIDVFETEPLPADHPFRSAPNLVLTPHLGASTHEAQESVGIEIAESIADFLQSGTVRNAINVPNVDAKTLAILRPYLELAEHLGSAVAQFTPTRCDSLQVIYTGKIADHETTAVTRAALKGFLKVTGSQVNEVNAPTFAERLGLQVSEQKQTGLEREYHELVTVRAVDSSGHPCEVSGTFFGSTPHLVRINGRSVEARPEGVLMVFENNDRPGIVGRIGTILGQHQVNIASMSLSRSEPGAQALSVLNLDSMPPEACLAALRAEPDISNLRFAAL